MAKERKSRKDQFMDSRPSRRTRRTPTSARDERQSRRQNIVNTPTSLPVTPDFTKSDDEDERQSQRQNVPSSLPVTPDFRKSDDEDERQSQRQNVPRSLPVTPDFRKSDDEEERQSQRQYIPSSLPATPDIPKSDDKDQDIQALKRDKSRHWRENQTEEQKERTRQLSRIRQKRYRESHREEINARKRAQVRRPKTEKERNKLQKQWREQKRARRSKLSRQKKQELNARRRELYLDKNNYMSLCVEDENTDERDKYKSKRALHEDENTGERDKYKSKRALHEDENTGEHDKYKSKRALHEDENTGEHDKYKSKRALHEDENTGEHDKYKSKRALHEDENTGEHDKYKSKRALHEDENTGERDKYKSKRELHEDENTGEHDKYKSKRALFEDENTGEHDKYKSKRALHEDENTGERDKYKSKRALHEEENTGERDKYKSKRALHEDENTGEHDKYKSRQALHKAVQKVKMVMPEDPRKYAECVQGLLNTTPRKRKALSNFALETPKTRRTRDEATECLANLRENLANTPNFGEHLLKRRILCGVLASAGGVKDLGLNWAFMARCSEIEEEKKSYHDYRKQRSDSLSKELVQLVEEYYLANENTSFLPSKKSIDTKTAEPLKAMTMSHRRLYEKFLEQYDEQISFSMFCKLRPSNIKTMSCNLFKQCLCEYCSNVELKLKVINKLADVGDKYSACNVTLCPKSDGADFYSKDCVTRKCDECGTRRLQQGIALDNLGCIDVEWQSWETVTFQHQSKPCKRKQIVHHNGSFRELVLALCNDLEAFAEHLHTARWQYKQFDASIKEIPENTVIACIDFAENYACDYQDEISGAHWSKEQATLFPAVTYYRCDNCETIVKDTVIVISNDLKHDSSSAFTFLNSVNSYLLQQREFKNEHIFSDGAPSHFKCSPSLSKLSDLKESHGFDEIQWHYFGSRHGKSPSDGEGGAVKMQVSAAVRNGTALVQNAKDFYNFCDEQLSKPRNEGNKCVHQRRNFIFVDTEDVNNNRPKEKYTTVTGIRKLFSVKVSGKDVKVRNLTCLCSQCNEEQSPKCVGRPWVDSWTTRTIFKTLTKKTDASKQQQIEDKETDDSSDDDRDFEVENNEQLSSEKLDNVKSENSTEDCVTVEYSDFFQENQVKGKEQQKMSLIQPRRKKRLPKIKISRKVQKQLKKIVSSSTISPVPSYTRYDFIIPIVVSMDLVVDYIKEDGNCFFRSLAKCLTGSELNYMDYRNIVVSFIEDFQEFFQVYVDGPMKSHIEKMKKNRTWASSCEIFGAATILKREIYMLTPTTRDEIPQEYQWHVFRPLDVGHSIDAGCGCHLSLINTAGIHYDRVCPRSGGCNCGIECPPIHIFSDETILSIGDSDMEMELSDNEPLVCEDPINDKQSDNEPPLCEDPINDKQSDNEPLVCEDPINDKQSDNEPLLCEDPINEKQSDNEPLVCEDPINEKQSDNEPLVCEDPINDKQSDNEPLVCEDPINEKQSDNEPLLCEDPINEKQSDDEPLLCEDPINEKQSDDEPLLCEDPINEKQSDDEPLLCEDPINEKQSDNEPLLCEDTINDKQSDDEPLLCEDPINEKQSDDEPLLCEDTINEKQSDDEPLVCEDPINEKQSDDEPLVCEDPINDKQSDNEPLLCEDPINDKQSDNEPLVCEDPINDKQSDNEPHLCLEPLVCKDPINEKQSDDEPLLCEDPINDKQSDNEPLLCFEPLVCEDPKQSDNEPLLCFEPLLCEDPINEKQSDNEPLLCFEPLVCEDPINDKQSDNEPLLCEDLINEKQSDVDNII